MKIVLDEGARMPTRAHLTDAGLDLDSREFAIIEPGKSHTFDTGVHMLFDSGTFGKIESKSGLNVAYSVVSCGGVLDEGYTGSVRVKLYNFGDAEWTVYPGDKLAQVVVQPYCVPPMEVVDSLPETERGSAGFGSTGL